LLSHHLEKYFRNSSPALESDRHDDLFARSLSRKPIVVGGILGRVSDKATFSCIERLFAIRVSAGLAITPIERRCVIAGYAGKASGPLLNKLGQCSLSPGPACGVRDLVVNGGFVLRYIIWDSTGLCQGKKALSWLPEITEGASDGVRCT
jgi:hypothetical protein